MTVVRKWSGDGLSAGSLGAGTGDNAFSGSTGAAPTVVATGTRSPQLQVDNTAAGSSTAYWSTLSPVLTQEAGRFYWTSPSAWPTAACILYASIFNDATLDFNIAITGTGSTPSAGLLRIYQGGTNRVTMTGALSLSTTYRIEWTWVQSTGVAVVYVYLGDSTTLIESLTTTQTWQASHNKFSFGALNLSPAIAANQYDDIAISDTATLIGPVASTPAVTVPLTGSGSLSVAVSNIFSVTPAFTGSGSLSVANIKSLAVAPAFSGSGTLSFALNPIRTVTADFTGSGALAVTTQQANAVALSFNGSGTLSVATSAKQNVNVPLTGTGTLSVSLTNATDPISVYVIRGGTLKNASYKIYSQGVENSATLEIV